MQIVSVTSVYIRFVLYVVRFVMFEFLALVTFVLARHRLGSEVPMWLHGVAS